jgi:hypothetical protein
MHNLLLGRDPPRGAALASWPMLARFENEPRLADLYRMREGLAETVIKRHSKCLGPRKIKHITID